MILLLVLNILLGLVIALYPLVTTVFCPTNNLGSVTWFSPANKLTLIKDYIWGISIIVLVLLFPNFYSEMLYHWFMVMMLISHVYRLLKNRNMEFCQFPWNGKIRTWTNIKLLAIVILEAVAIVKILINNK